MSQTRLNERLNINLSTESCLREAIVEKYLRVKMLFVDYKVKTLLIKITGHVAVLYDLHFNTTCMLCHTT